MSTQQDATVNIHVNNQEAEQKVKELSDRARQLRQEFADAVRIGDKGTIAKTNKELQKVNKELNNATLRSARVRDAMKHLSEATPKELRNTLKLINAELNSGAVKRGSEEWKQYQQQIKLVNDELKKIKDESTSLGEKSSNFGKNWWGTIDIAKSGFDLLKQGVESSVQAYVKLDTAMASTQKFTGMTREEVERLNEEMKKIDTRTSLEGLHNLAQAAGRLGKTSVDDIMGFVRAGDMIGVAMDELGEEAPEIISKLSAIFNLEGEMGTEQAMLATGSAINTLSQVCASSAPNLVEFASRMGAVASSSKMSMDELLAFGAVLDSNGVTMEKGATAMQGVISKMFAEPAKFAKAAGLDINEFSAALQRSSTEGIMMFVDALSRMDQMTLSATLKDLRTAGSGVTQTFQTLANKSAELRQRIQESNQAFLEAKSVGEEFAVQNNTVEAQLDKSKEKLHQLAGALGQQLMPVVNVAISGISLLITVLKSLLGIIVNNKAAVLTLVAAYTAYHIAVKKAMITETAHNLLTKAGIALKTTWTATTRLAASVVAICTGNVKKATVAWRAFSMALKANPIGLLVGAITAAVGALITWISTSDDAADKAEELAQKNKELKDSFTDISNSSADLAKKEITQLNKLYNAATNDKKSKEERRKAADKLIKQYPEYFKNVSAEIIMVGKAKGQYDKLATSILATAKARAAASKIEENQGEILRLKEERRKNLQQQKAAYQKWQDAEKALKEYKGGTREVYDPTSGQYVSTSYTQEWVKLDQAARQAKAQWELLGDQQIEIYCKINIINDSNDFLAKIVGDTPTEYEPDPAFNPSSAYTSSGKGSSSTTNAADEAQKQRREREKQAQQLADQELQTATKVAEALQIINRAQYTLGAKDYLQYTQTKNNITLAALAQQKKALENAGLQDTEVYAKILKREEELLKKHSSEILDLNLDMLEQKHNAEVDAATSAYYTPGSATFQNQKAYNQQLLDIDVKYLTAKRDLYARDSKEWLEINRQINQRISDDQLQKQQETADAYLRYQEEYGKASGSIREKLEIGILDNLHAQGLISEEEYQEAVKKIKDKYRNEDTNREREKIDAVQSEYGDMVENLYQAFKTLFENLGKEGADFWGNLSNAANATYAVMAAGLAQYTAYADASRDLEIAKVEQQYDAEIEKAANNTKRKEQLEKEKEAKIAAIKKKHNDRAMKIEIAQAVAQTAMAAIAAYASGSKVNVFLGPIAAALALAAGAVQIATIKKQHQAQALGYYQGGYTSTSPDDRKEVGVVHANEFVANHNAVANPRLRPLFDLLDAAQRNNTVGSLTAHDVSAALGQGQGVEARATVATTTTQSPLTQSLDLMAATSSAAASAIDRLNRRIDDGIETVMIMDGERGFAKKYEHYQKLKTNPQR